MEKSLKKTQIALFSLLSLVFMFGIVLFSIIKQKEFLNNYKFGTEEKIKELFKDYLNSNYQYTKKEEILDHLFYNSFSFFNTSKNSFFSKKLVKDTNIFNYSLNISSSNEISNEFKNFLEKTGLDLYSGQKINVLLKEDESSSEKLLKRSGEISVVMCLNEKNSCDKSIKINKEAFENKEIFFFKMLFSIFLLKNENKIKKDGNNLNLVFKNANSNFKKNIESFFNITNFGPKKNITITKEFLRYSILFPISNKYEWVLDQISKKTASNDYEEYFEKTIPEKWFYTFEKKYFIVCREVYNIKIKEFFNFYDWKRDNLKVVDCLAFKIKDKNKLEKFLKDKEIEQAITKESYNNLQYINLNLFYLLSSNKEKEINNTQKNENYKYNYVNDLNSLLEWFINSNKKTFDKEKYISLELTKEEKKNLIEEFGVYKTLSIGKNELILLSNKFALTNIYSQDKSKYELVIKVKNGCSDLPFSRFFYVKDKKGLKNLVGEHKDLFLQSSEKIEDVGDYYFYHITDLKTESEYCILSEEDSLLE